jgi:hypothetical protein
MRKFGHVRIDRDETGAAVGQKLSPARAKTVGTLGRNYGPDRDRRLVVSLDAGDVVSVRPERTARALTITAQDLYAYLLRCQANRAVLEKARTSKARKAQRLASLRQKRAERRLIHREGA